MKELNIGILQYQNYTFYKSGRTQILVLLRLDH